MWAKLIGIGLAGAAGALARSALHGWVQRLMGGEGTTLAFPWGTLVVNSAGCFAFGLVWALTSYWEKISLDNALSVSVMAGFLGAFTTFSTFGFETGHLIEHGRWGTAISNVLSQNLIGILLAMLGVALGRALASSLG